VLSQDCIQQCRFANIWPTDERDEAGAADGRISTVVEHSGRRTRCVLDGIQVIRPIRFIGGSQAGSYLGREIDGILKVDHPGRQAHETLIQLEDRRGANFAALQTACCVEIEDDRLTERLDRRIIIAQCDHQAFKRSMVPNAWMLKRQCKIITGDTRVKFQF
jgi:hypothetical protein